MLITPEVLVKILKDYEKPEDLLSENGWLKQLAKALIELAVNGELGVIITIFTSAMTEL